MKLTDEKYVEISFDELNLKKEDVDSLCEIGIQLIKKDPRSLVEYTINQLMNNVIDALESKTTPKKKIALLKQYIKVQIQKEK